MLNLDSLNETQRNAVIHGEGPLLVLAGPGSGKTYTITQRIFYLIEKKKIPPEKILVITFTKDAALSMQSRFRQLSDTIYPVPFGTFHSIFYTILKESHYTKLPQLISYSQKKNLLLPLMKQRIPKDELSDRQENLPEEAGSLIAAVSYYKNTANKEAAVQKTEEQWRSCFDDIFNEYERARTACGMLDFDDMVYECGSLLEKNPKIRQYWQNRFSHILIDEFQDISPMQYKVVRLLASPCGNVFAVGDDDQSIYGFRGANPGCLMQFVEDYHAEKICLNINYRSRKEIVNLSMRVIAENKKRFLKDLRATPEREAMSWNRETVKLYAFGEAEEQYKYLRKELYRHYENTKLKLCGERKDDNTKKAAAMNWSADTKSVSNSDIEKRTVGVLFRTNLTMQRFAASLRREGIPFCMKEKAANIYEHFIVRDILAYIRLAQNKGSRADFLQVMNKPSRYISREAVGEGAGNFQNIIQYYRRQTSVTYSEKVIADTVRWEKQMQSLSRLNTPYAAVQYIRKVIGYDAYVRKKAGADLDRLKEWQEVLDFVAEDAAFYDNMEDWTEAQKEGNREESKQESGEAIVLMTVHASKGLEYDTVYIPDCNERVFPHGSLPDAETCEEERRLFFVAMTRAKKSLELLYLTGTEKRPRLPSRFLNPLLHNQSLISMSSMISSNSQVSKYSSKASATFSYSSSSSM